MKTVCIESPPTNTPTAMSLLHGEAADRACENFPRWGRLGVAVRLWREHLGMSIEDVAVAVSLGTVFIESLEGAESVPFSNAVGERIAEWLGMDLRHVIAMWPSR